MGSDACSMGLMRIQQAGAPGYVQTLTRCRCRWSKTMIGFADEVGRPGGSRTRMTRRRLGAPLQASVVAGRRPRAPLCRNPAGHFPLLPALLPAQDSSFVLELTYNYGVPFYRRGNELGYLKVRNRVAFKTLEEQVGASRMRAGGTRAACCMSAGAGWQAAAHTPSPQSWRVDHGFFRAAGQRKPVKAYDGAPHSGAGPGARGGLQRAGGGVS
jgi:hypothetical protein